MRTLVLTRFYESEVQTLGRAQVYSPDVGLLFECKTLELPWKNNQKRISRIPDNSYLLTKHTSPRFGECLLVNDVPDRSHILIHKGNYYTDILGCILVGDKFVDINNDGHLDVINSNGTMERLMSVLDNENHLNIIEQWEKK